MSETTTPKTQPVTVQPEDYEKIVGYLMEMPAKIAIPLLNYFQQQQAKAQQLQSMQKPKEPTFAPGADDPSS